MSRRKPVPITIDRAAENLFWRARVYSEMVDGLALDQALRDRIKEAGKRLEYALEDYEASKGVQTATGPLFGQEASS